MNRRCTGERLDRHALFFLFVWLFPVIFLLFFFFFVFFFQFFKLDCNNLSKCQLLCWQPAECKLRLKSGRLLGFGQREVLCVHVMAGYCYLIQYERKDYKRKIVDDSCNALLNFNIWRGIIENHVWYLTYMWLLPAGS